VVASYEGYAGGKTQPLKEVARERQALLECKGKKKRRKRQRVDLTAHHTRVNEELGGSFGRTRPETGEVAGPGPWPKLGGYAGRIGKIKERGFPHTLVKT